MISGFRARRAGILGAALAIMMAGFAGEGKNTSVGETVPENIFHLKEIEQAVTEIAERIVPCTVGIQIGGYVEGSGVVISEDGYVLTAAHVSGRPGGDVTIRFPDGKTAPGETLGIHAEVDAGLVKITGPGKWPFVPLVSPEDPPQLGDWCVATGHPGGFQDKRTPPVRLGRVIDVDDYTLRTDCTITRGDSGGPLFDLQGRVIGIHSRISQEATVNLHGPVLACVEALDHLKAGEIYPPAPASRFLIRFDNDGDGKVHHDECPDGLYRRAYARLAKKYDLDINKSYTIDELKVALGWRVVPRLLTIQPYEPGDRSGKSLSRNQFVRGTKVRAAFKPIVSEVARSTVDILCDGEKAAFGAIVDSAGLVVTKASQLSGKVVCQIQGKEFPARVASTDLRNDLALLKIDAQDLPAVKWAKSDDLRPGSWLATPSPNKGAVSVGIVSVAEREIAGTPGVLGIEMLNPGDPVITRIIPKSGASLAGLMEHDVVTKIADQRVQNLGEIQQALETHRAGEVVKAIVSRDGEELEFEIKLGMREDVFQELMPFEVRLQSRLNGPRNWRRDDFPTAIQHDSVLLPTQCGGPVVDVSGNAIGINVARADRTVSYAVPSELVMPLIEKMKNAEWGE